MLEAVRRLQDWQRSRDAKSPSLADAESASEEEEANFDLSDSSGDEDALWTEASKDEGGHAGFQSRALVDGEEDSASETDENNAQLEASAVAGVKTPPPAAPSLKEETNPQPDADTNSSPDAWAKKKKHGRGGWRGAGVRRLKKETNGEQAGGPRSLQEEELFVPRLTAVPLYANLPREAQDMALREPLPTERRVIVSTNVAETSLTLPNIRQVQRRVFLFVPSLLILVPSLSLFWPLRRKPGERAVGRHCAVYAVHRADT